MKANCPYCGRKIKYSVRFKEKGEGEHICKNCKKPSDIVQNKSIWLLFAVCGAATVLILVFYLCFGNIIQREFNQSGSYKVLVDLFFGNLKLLKWALWELLPYLVFYFVSPLFVSFKAQSKYAHGSTQRINLETDFVNAANEPEDFGENTRVISKLGRTMVEDDYDFQNISSNSESMGDTKSFKLNDGFVNINTEPSVKYASGKSDAPLKKVERVKPVKTEEPYELYRVKVLREQERLKKQEQEEKRKNPDALKDKSFSANRKF